METRYLKTLLAVLESGSFSRAANDINVTQSAVSQRIKFMEDQYGLSLIDRTGAVIVPTEAGRIVSRKAQQILTIEAELDNEIKSLKTKTRLSIACTPTFGITLLPKVLSRFILANSEDAGVESHVSTPEKVLKGVLDNEFDIGVIEHCFDLDSTTIGTITLEPDKLAIVSAPSLGIRNQELSLDELLGHRLVARRDGCSSRFLLENNLCQLGKSLSDFQSIVVHDDLNLTINSVLSGLGVAFISRSLVEDYIEKGRLIEHSLAGFSYSRSRSIIFNRKSHDNTHVKAFIECVQKTF